MIAILIAIGFESFFASPFNILDAHFPPGFFAEGRRGRTQKLENEQNSLKMHFQNLECHFSPGFLAEGRRGGAKKLENTLSKFMMPFSTRILRRRPPRANKTTLKYEYGK